MMETTPVEQLDGAAQGEVEDDFGVIPVSFVILTIFVVKITTFVGSRTQ
jgi:hypothetical protein